MELNISEVAKRYGMTPATLRYYEKKGLLPKVTRNHSGIRDFQEADIQWIEFVRCMKESGLSIESLAKYSDLYQVGDETLIERKEILLTEYKKLVEKQKLINETVNRLEQKLKNYDNKIEVWQKNRGI